MDSTEPLSHNMAIDTNIGKRLKQEGLECGGQGKLWMALHTVSTCSE